MSITRYLIITTSVQDRHDLLIAESRFPHSSHPLIVLAHAPIECSDALTVKTEAEQPDTKQDAELEQMVTMLEQ